MKHIAALFTCVALCYGQARAANASFTDLAFTNEAGQITARFTPTYFEATSFPPSGWSTAGNSPWVRDTSVSHSGSASAKSGNVADSQTNILTYTVIGPGEVRFWYKVSSESGFDFLGFYTNKVGNPAAGATGNWNSNPGLFRVSGTDADWTFFDLYILPGVNTLNWIFAKDGSDLDGDNAGYVDDVQFTAATNLNFKGDFYLLGGMALGGTTNLSLTVQTNKSVTHGINTLAATSPTNLLTARQTAMGFEVLKSLTNGSDNTGFGVGVFDVLGVGAHNTGVGSGVGQPNFRAGNENTFVGDDVFFAGITGDKNSCVGRLAVSGSTNINRISSLGWGAGASLATGSNCTFLGTSSDSTAPGPLTNSTAVGADAKISADNQMVLGNLVKDYLFSDGAVQINSNTVYMATNRAPFTFIRTNLLSGQRYTNLDQRAYVVATIALTNILAGDVSSMSLIVDQDADGAWDTTNGPVRLDGVALSAGSWQLSGLLQPGATFSFTNQSAGTSPSATIVPGTCQWSRW